MSDIETLGDARDAGWALSVRCDRRREGLKSVRPCVPSHAYLDLDTMLWMVQRFGWDFDIVDHRQQLRRRLVCSICGARWPAPDYVAITGRWPLHMKGADGPDAARSSAKRNQSKMKARGQPKIGPDRRTKAPLPVFLRHCAHRFFCVTVAR